MDSEVIKPNALLPHVQLRQSRHSHLHLSSDLYRVHCVQYRGDRAGSAAEHLPSALRCLQQAADGTASAAGASSAASPDAAEASLQLALLCDQLLQVRCHAGQHGAVITLPHALSDTSALNVLERALVACGLR